MLVARRPPTCWELCGKLAGSTIPPTQLYAASKPNIERNPHPRLIILPLNMASILCAALALLASDAPSGGYEPGVKAAADIAMHPASIPACFLLYCLGLLLRGRPNRTSGLGGALHGCKPRLTREMRCSKCAAEFPSFLPASRGQQRGVRRAAPLLLLAWLGVCSADKSVQYGPSLCSVSPSVCDGTYSKADLCAPSPKLPPPL